MSDLLTGQFEPLPASDSMASAGENAVLNGHAMQQVKTKYTTAVAVQKPREMAEVQRTLLEEARLAGETFYYGWGTGKNRIEGASVGLAMAAARCFRNCAVDVLPIQETESAWFTTAVFIDLETGVTLSRPFRQSKKWNVHGKHDEDRKDDIRFQIGQSKAVRNVVLNALPDWLINQAMAEAKQGVRAKIEQYISTNGLPAAVELVLGGLAKHGVTEQHVLEKCEVSTTEALTIDNMVILRGDLSALDGRQEYASNLFPSMAGSTAAGGKATKSDLDDAVQTPPKPTEPAAADPAADEVMQRIQQEVNQAEGDTLDDLYNFYVGPDSPLGEQGKIDTVSGWIAERRGNTAAK